MRYFIAVLVVIFFVVLGSVLLIGRDRPANVSVESKDVTVTNYIDSTTSKVVWTQQGELVGNNERFAVRISVSPTSRTIELLGGYNERVVKSKTYDNNKDAYRVFLKALDNLGFGEVRERTVEDEEGVCPTGRRYIYELFEGAQSRLHSWSTSCSRNDGTFDGVSAETVRVLFRDQITDYSDVIRGISF